MGDDRIIDNLSVAFASDGPIRLDGYNPAHAGSHVPQRHFVRMASRSNRATLTKVRRIHTPSNPTASNARALPESHRDPLTCPMTSTATGTRISTPNCCAVRGSLTRDEIAIAI